MFVVAYRLSILLDQTLVFNRKAMDVRNQKKEKEQNGVKEVEQYGKGKRRIDDMKAS
jgi:hypothetical protein